MSERVIYVGYLPLPAKHARFLRVFAPSALWTLAVLAGVSAWKMRDPGPAVWNTGAVERWTGTVIVEPYPRLVVESEDGRTRSLFVVEQGKFGSRARLSAWDGKRVALTGWLLERDDRRIIELEPGDGAIEAAAGATVLPLAVELGEMEVEGEIVDTKCFLGAMKPGDGRAHRACATLCIRNGIPAILFREREEGSHEYFVLTDGEGGSAAGMVLDTVGLPVRVRGVARRVGDIVLLRVESVALR